MNAEKLNEIYVSDPKLGKEMLRGFANQILNYLNTELLSYYIYQKIPGLKFQFYNMYTQQEEVLYTCSDHHCNHQLFQYNVLQNTNDIDKIIIHNPSNCDLKYDVITCSYCYNYITPYIDPSYGIIHEYLNENIHIVDISTHNLFRLKLLMQDFMDYGRTSPSYDYFYIACQLVELLYNNMMYEEG